MAKLICTIVNYKGYLLSICIGVSGKSDALGSVYLNQLGFLRV